MVLKNLSKMLTPALFLGIWLSGSLSGLCFCNPQGSSDGLTVSGVANSEAFKTAEATSLQSSPKHQGDETALIYYGYRYYNASAGRWICRDPAAEIGGINLYGFIRNSSLGRIDPDGLTDVPTPQMPAAKPPQSQSSVGKSKFTARVSKCEIVIVFGHSMAGDPWKFGFDSDCAAGGVVACWPGQSNGKISQPIDRLEMHNEIGWWLPPPGSPGTSLNKGIHDAIVIGREDGNERDLRVALGNAINGAVATAKKICKKDCCPSVLIRGYRVELSGAGNRNIPPGFTIIWDCAKKAGFAYGDDGAGPFYWP
jgi:RHS repeat-associated protein